MGRISKIVWFIDGINYWIGRTLYPLILVMCGVVFAEILMRTIFNAPTTWTFETTQFLFIICTFLAAGHLYHEGEHITVDIFYSRYSRKVQIILDIITFPFFLLFIGSMVYFGYEFAMDSLMKYETTGSVWDPIVFPIKFAVPIGALLLLLQAICKLIMDIQELCTGKVVSKLNSSEDLGSY